MQVKIEVAVRDAIEQKFIDDTTKFVTDLVQEKNLPIKRICFARKSSYGGVRASTYHLYGSRTDKSDKEIWINIKECSTDMTPLVHYLGRALYWYACKEKTVDKKQVSESQYVQSLFGQVQTPAAVAAPVARERAAAPKAKNKPLRQIITSPNGHKVAYWAPLNKTRNETITDVARFISIMIDDSPNKINEAQVGAWVKSQRYALNQDQSPTKVEVNNFIRSGSNIQGSEKIKEIHVTIKDFDDMTFGLTIAKLLSALGYQKVVKPEDMMDELDLLAQTLTQGVDAQTLKVAVACKNYAKRILTQNHA